MERGEEKAKDDDERGEIKGGKGDVSFSPFQSLLDPMPPTDGRDNCIRNFPPALLHRHRPMGNPCKNSFC